MTCLSHRHLWPAGRSGLYTADYEPGPAVDAQASVGQQIALLHLPLHDMLLSDCKGAEVPHGRALPCLGSDVTLVWTCGDARKQDLGVPII